MVSHLLQPHPDAGRVSHEAATLDPTPSAPLASAAGGALTGLENGDRQQENGLTIGTIRPTFRPQDWAKAGQKLAKLQAFWSLRARRVPVADAAHSVGVTRIEIWRWLQRLDAVGLTPASDPNDLRLALLDRKSPGRDCEWAYLLKQPEAVHVLESAYLSTLGASHEAAARDRRTGQVSLALEWFAEHPLCPAPLAARLRKGYQPAAFVAHLRRITPEVEAMVRGSKNFLHNGLVSRRDGTVLAPDGLRYAMPAGFIVEMDDESENTPFFVRHADGSITYSRQTLNARDVLSKRLLAVEAIARPREAYRSADILRFIMKLCQDYGKPTVLRLEKGIWLSRIIYGIALAPDGRPAVNEDGSLIEEEWTVAGADPEEKQLLHRGLEAAGIKIDYVTGSHKKGGIESSFRRRQDAVALFTQEFIKMGRHAGEFEHAAKAMRRARSESHTPEQLGIAPQEVLADRIALAFAWLNGKSKTGPSADDKWFAGTAARPLPKPTLLDTAFMMPDQRTLTISGGKITATVNGQPLDFRAPALFAQLGDGARVSIRFDSLQPHLSAAVFDAAGRFLDWATYEVPGPGYRADDMALVAGLEPVAMAKYGRNQNLGYQLRKQQQDFVTAVYRSLPRPGQPAVKGTFQHPPAPECTVEVHPPTPTTAPTPAPARERRLTAAQHLLAQDATPISQPDEVPAWA